MHQVQPDPSHSRSGSSVSFGQQSQYIVSSTSSGEMLCVLQKVPIILAGCLTRAPKFLFPTSKPILLNFRSLCIRQVCLGVAIHKESNCKHVAIGSLMSDAFACFALHSVAKGATAFVRASNLTLRRTRGASSSTIVAAIVTLAVVSTVIGVAVTNVCNSIPTCTAVYPIKVPTAAQNILFYPKSTWA